MIGSIVYRPEATEDIVSCALFIGEENPLAAERFLDSVKATLDRLVEMPQLGRARSCESEELDGIRSWPVKGFEKHLVFYRPTGEAVEVIRVLHGSRDLAGLMRIVPDGDL